MLQIFVSLHRISTSHMDNSALFESNLVHLVARVPHVLNSLLGFVTNYNFVNINFVLFC